MSFKEFSSTHNTQAKTKTKNDLKTGPLVDQPPAPPSKTPKEKITGTKP
jgi:hypothetical protein